MNVRSDQKCPYCGGSWFWTRKRSVACKRQGFLLITCHTCGKEFNVNKEAKVIKED